MVIAGGVGGNYDGDFREFKLERILEVINGGEINVN
jgi:hypothetical protein